MDSERAAALWEVQVQREVTGDHCLVTITCDEAIIRRWIVAREEEAVRFAKAIEVELVELLGMIPDPENP